MTESIDKQLERSNKLLDEREERRRELISAFVQATGEIGRVEKDRENPFAKSKYATLDAILDEVKPILSKHGLAMSQISSTRVSRMNEKEYEICVESSLYHSNGEVLDLGELFMPLEKGRGMNSAQSAGSTITYCRRYSVTSIFGISTGEDTDGTPPRSEPNAPEYKQPEKKQDNSKKIQDEIQKHQAYLLDSGVDLQKITQYILKQENADNLNDVDPIRVMGHYQALATKRRTEQRVEKKKKKEEVEAKQTKLDGTEWGVSSKYE